MDSLFLKAQASRVPQKLLGAPALPRRTPSAGPLSALRLAASLSSTHRGPRSQNTGLAGTAARAAELETSLTARQAEVERLRVILKQQRREIPDGYKCPISTDLMEDPVIAADGHSYERRDIAAWFARGKRTSPKTGARLPHTHLTPNHNLKSAIRDFLEEVRSFDAATAGARD